MFKKPLSAVYLVLAFAVMLSLVVGVVGGAFAGSVASYALVSQQAKLVAAGEARPIAISQPVRLEQPRVDVVRQPAAESPVAEPPTQVTISSDEEDRLLESIYERANPSVVNIQVTSQVGVSMRRMPDFRGLPKLPEMPGLPPELRKWFEDQFGRGDNGGQNDEEQQQDAPGYFTRGEGSGFVYDRQGHIVTNNHVVEGAKTIRVTFFDGISVPAKLVGTDPDSDLAVIKIDPKGLDLVPLPLGDSRALKVGQRVIAIGNPFGLNNTMTTGIVSALGRSLPVGTTGLTRFTIPDVIQTDAAINPGNSGGPLLNSAGEVVGVNSAIESPVRAWAGVGFAIPSAIVAKVVPVLIEGKDVQHPWLGISGTTLNPQLNEKMGLPANQRGVLVVEVTKDSPAAKAGLQPSTKKVTIDGVPMKVGGDVIVSINGTPVRQFDDLLLYLTYNAEVGDKVTLTLLRDGKNEDITVELMDRPNVSQWDKLFTTEEPQP
mgnify:CR=1 FL=1